MLGKSIDQSYLTTSQFLMVIFLASVVCALFDEYMYKSGLSLQLLCIGSKIDTTECSDVSSLLVSINLHKKLG